ncbi:LysR family transcriptional regulator [Dyella psychrodurans]|uniref:LysR family transcriptional regulator n=1 Tax=Dyella psychrodurans TaxID=1927960 RepID=A0A370XCA1_9GAMM|nr:LysR family transcriptional regulator [Dyella psychrodurans]RDS86064.1 LysR family transcriptional regulator [Dyella psychrodurans]
MDRLEAMRILLAAVDTGSLSAASRQLRIPLATVSRRVLELEEHLSVRLLLRGTRKLTLTDAGRDYVASCRRILEDLMEAERTATGEYRAPQGELVISAPLVVGRHHVVPVLVEFLQAYPKIRARIQLSDRVSNLLEEQVDVAVRLGELPDSEIIATRIALISRVLCASPAYLASHGVPKEPNDLVSHECITYEGYSAADRWEFGLGRNSQVVQVASRLIVNSAEAAVIAAIADAGVARVLSDQVVEPLESGALVRLLQAFEPTPMPASLVYPRQRHVPLKLRAFLDFVTPRLRQRLGYESPRSS